MYHTKAIILSIHNFRENDKIINFYTKDFGKKEIIATGTRKINSKLNPHLQYFAALEISCAKGKNLDRLTYASLKNNYSNIKSSIEAISSGKFCLEILDNFIKSSHADEKIFNLLIEFFSFLDANIKISQLKGLLISVFLLKISSVMGYAPELYSCLKCKNKIKEEKNYFNFRKGGVICPKCHQEDLAEVGVFPKVIKYLRLFLNEDMEIIKKIKSAESSLKEVERIIMKFLEFHHSFDYNLRKI